MQYELFGLVMVGDLMIQPRNRKYGKEGIERKDDRKRESRMNEKRREVVFFNDQILHAFFTSVFAY